MKHLLALALVVCSGLAQATVYDLNADWSDSSNPNGVWTYREGTNAIPHVAAWQKVLGGWTTDQPGWAYSQDGNDRLPFFFKSNGTETFAHDFLAGDVVVHTWDGVNGVGHGQANFLWTTPGAGVIDVTGAVWMGRDIGRTVDWSVFKNDTLLTQGEISSGDAYDRAHPFDLLTGTGGSANLTGINVAAGDTIMLKLETASVSGDFVGTNLTVDYQAVPEPVTLSVAALGLLALRRRRR